MALRRFGPLFSYSMKRSIGTSTSVSCKIVSFDEKKLEPEKSEQLDSIDRSLITKKEPGYDFYKVNSVAEYFDSQKEKDYYYFKKVIGDYDSHKIPHHEISSVDFVYGALKKMRDFGVHKNIQAYNDLLNVFPKEKMVHRTTYQKGYWFFAKHHSAGVEILDAMETNNLIPNEETTELVKAIFGEFSQVFAKVGRMIYWITKARYNDPYPMPTLLPEDPKELAIIGLRRMSVDVNTKISVFSTECIPESIDKTWVMSAIAPKQIELLNELSETLYIDGPHWCWMKDYPISYFILKTGPKKIEPEEEEDMEDLTNLPLYAYGGFSKKHHLEVLRKLHISEEGTILSLIATGTSTRDSLLSWLRIMQHHLPKLKDLSVIFNLKKPTSHFREFIPEYSPDEIRIIGLKGQEPPENRIHSALNATETQLKNLESLELQEDNRESKYLDGQSKPEAISSQ